MISGWINDPIFLPAHCAAFSTALVVIRRQLMLSRTFEYWLACLCLSWPLRRVLCDTRGSRCFTATRETLDGVFRVIPP